LTVWSSTFDLKLAKLVASALGAGVFMSRLESKSHCKVNLLLNILGKRADGFHELETLMHPVALHDTLQVESVSGSGLSLTCSLPGLPTDKTNLVHRAATSFLQATGITDGIRIHLEKRIPLAAGLGGGSGNAATTLLALNELFGQPLSTARLTHLAAELGSDVPFFLQSMPALATGRGEQVTPLSRFPALRGVFILLIHPGFGVSTAWAYQALSRFPVAQKGTPGRGARLAASLKENSLKTSAPEFYNSLEVPVLEKYPILALYQDFLRSQGAAVALMSGSGSTTFALFYDEPVARDALAAFRSKFGEASWAAIVSLDHSMPDGHERA
jgi:4-diphosphocytidyl-2-C-methyl-D-erythritol kinase